MLIIVNAANTNANAYATNANTKAYVANANTNDLLMAHTTIACSWHIHGTLINNVAGL